MLCRLRYCEVKAGNHLKLTCFSKKLTTWYFFNFFEVKIWLYPANYIVAELEVCQKARKTGYVDAIPKEDKLWEEVSNGNIRSHRFDLNGAWSPWYTVHKIMAGLLDAYLYCNIKKLCKWRWACLTGQAMCSKILMNNKCKR
jgi:hypothetical protein